MKTKKLVQVCSILVAGLVATGCATTKTPLYSRPDFQPTSADKLCVLPVFDARIDKSLNVNLEKNIQQVASRNLCKRKFKCECFNDPACIAGILPDDLQESTFSWATQAGPPDARYLVLFTLHELSRKMVFGSTGTAEMSLIVVDKASGEVLYRDKTVAQVGQGGLLGMMLAGLMDESAVQQGVFLLMQKFPRHPKKV